MATITFNDGSGSQTISSAWPAPANRFNNWISKRRPIGERATAVGDGKRYQFALRTDYGASFQLDGIADNATNQDKLTDFEAWANAGGEFTVTTADPSGTHTYSECALAPDVDVQFVKDRKRKCISLVLDVINVAASPSQMLCAY